MVKTDESGLAHTPAVWSLRLSCIGHIDDADIEKHPCPATEG